MAEAQRHSADVPADTFRRIAALPIWQGELKLRPLLGGISNESWHVTDEAGEHVVRFLPPLNVKDGDLEEALEMIGDALDQLYSEEEAGE